METGSGRGVDQVDVPVDGARGNENDAGGIERQMETGFSVMRQFFAFDDAGTEGAVIVVVADKIDDG